MREVEIENDRAFDFNVDVRNRYEMNSGWGHGDFQVVDRASKRKRIRTGSSSSITPAHFYNLTTDDKLSALFDLMTNVQLTQNRAFSEIQSIKYSISGAYDKAEHVGKRVDVHARKLRMLSYKSIDLEARSRRNNLVFWGITENVKRGCEDLILDFLTHEMRIDTGGMVIDRAHRLGVVNNTHIRNKLDPKRPIIVRFRDYRDVDHVLDNAYRLKGSRFRVDRDYPKEIVDARTRLYQCSEAYNARKRRSKIQVRYPAKLYIDNRLVRDEFPDWGDLMKESRVVGFEVDDAINSGDISNSDNTVQSTGARIRSDSVSNISYRDACKNITERSQIDESLTDEHAHTIRQNTDQEENMSWHSLSQSQSWEASEGENKPKNFPSKSTNFSVESLLLLPPTCSQDKENNQSSNSENLLICDENFPIQLEEHVHENEKVKESQCNVQSTLPEKQDGNSIISTPLISSEPVENAQIHSNDVHSQLLSQNILVNNKTCTVDTDKINVSRSQSIERSVNTARASSVDSCLQKSMGVNMRPSRSSVRKMETKCSDAKQYICDRSPSEVRSDILAPTKFKFKHVNSQGMTHNNNDNPETQATGDKQRSTTTGAKNNSNKLHEQNVSNRADNRGVRNQDTGADNLGNPSNGINKQ